MVWCVEERSWALRPFEGYDDALAYFLHVPDALLHMKPLQAATKAAGDVMVALLGPMEKLWRPGSGRKWKKQYLLDERVVALPIGGIEALLRSEQLQLKSENYAYTLDYSWVVMMQGGHWGQRGQLLFNRLLKSLRYARTSAFFLSTIAQFHAVQASGLLPAIMTRAFWRRSNAPRANPVTLPASRVKPPDRKSYSVHFSTHFTKAAIEAQKEPGHVARAYLGILHGLPLYVDAIRLMDGHISLGIFSDFIQLQTKDGARHA